MKHETNRKAMTDSKHKLKFILMAVVLTLNEALMISNDNNGNTKVLHWMNELLQF